MNADLCGTEANHAPDPDTDELRKEIASSLAWAFQALLAVSAFCVLTAASHGDGELLTGGAAIVVPIAGITVDFLFLFLIGPMVLLAMQIYLQLQTRALLRVPHALATNGLLFNHARRWPVSLLGFASYGVVPAATAFLLWKIWPRGFTDDWRLPGGVHLNRMIAAVAVMMVVACWCAAIGALADRRCLLAARGAPPDAVCSTRLNAAFGVLLALGLALALASALPGRHLDMRKARLAGADLRNFDLGRADLREAELRGARLGGAMLTSAVLVGATLDGADLRGAQLNGADMVTARLNRADLTGARMIAANLGRVEIEGARFDYAWMQGAVFEPAPETPLDRTASPSPPADGLIHAASFSHAELCGAAIVPAHWSEQAMGALAGIETMPVPPFYSARDLRDARRIPPAFHAETYPAQVEADEQAEARRAFLARTLPRCLEAKSICDRPGYAASCAAPHPITPK